MRDIAGGLETAAAAGQSADLDERCRRSSVSCRRPSRRACASFASSTTGAGSPTPSARNSSSRWPRRSSPRSRPRRRPVRQSDLAATARALRELHSQWQEVAEAPRQSAQRLWDRFRLATDFIRARCEAYFQKLREERQVSLEKKTELVVEAETLAGVERLGEDDRPAAGAAGRMAGARPARRGMPNTSSASGSARRATASSRAAAKTCPTARRSGPTIWRRRKRCVNGPRRWPRRPSGTAPRAR